MCHNKLYTSHSKCSKHQGECCKCYMDSEKNSRLETCLPAKCYIHVYTSVLHSGIFENLSAECT